MIVWARLADCNSALVPKINKLKLVQRVCRQLHWQLKEYTSKKIVNFTLSQV